MRKASRKRLGFSAVKDPLACRVRCGVPDPAGRCRGGYAFAPVAYVIGLPWKDAQVGGALLGEKLFLTEFIAFIDLGAVPDGVIAERSRMIMTYALCGFANVASVGIMTGGMTVLMPERRAEIFALAWKALLPGFMATLMTAAIVAALPEALF